METESAAVNPMTFFKAQSYVSQKAHQSVFETRENILGKTYKSCEQSL